MSMSRSITAMKWPACYMPGICLIIPNLDMMGPSRWIMVDFWDGSPEEFDHPWCNNFPKIQFLD